MAIKKTAALRYEEIFLVRAKLTKTVALINQLREEKKNRFKKKRTVLIPSLKKRKLIG